MPIMRATRFAPHRLPSAKSGLHADIVRLPARQDPNSYFAAGASAVDFLTCLKEATSL